MASIIDSTAITIVVKDVIVPELLALLHKQMPTDGEMVIKLSKDADDIKAIGQAFLDQTRPTSQP